MIVNRFYTYTQEPSTMNECQHDLDRFVCLPRELSEGLPACKATTQPVWMTKKLCALGGPKNQLKGALSNH